MSRWKVCKAPNGMWWAHHPNCIRFHIVCLFNGHCGLHRTMAKAVTYAARRAAIDKHRYTQMDFALAGPRKGGKP